MYKFVLLCIIINLCALLTSAQKQGNIWYFGHNAGLDFSSGNPVVLNDGQIFTDEGVAGICDANGKLLFYTEGTTVWNKDHGIMPNGTGLLGSFSSSQSAIIVPEINDTSRYYIFTVDELGQPNGLNYSIVNMSLDGGLGDVEIKDVPMQSPVCEKITAVKHCNGKDIWVIVHGWNSDAFYAYLITSAGINLAPVISRSGRSISSANENFSIGYLKASPNGRKLACASDLLGLDLLDFDNATGIVSNGISMFLPGEGYTHAYGVEFSPDSKLLYTTVFYFDLTVFFDSNALLQYDVSQHGATSIIASKKVIYRENFTYQMFAALQIAPDGKMYMAQFVQPYISVINDPDSIGTACNFELNKIILTPNQSTFGLPNFIQSYWKPGFTFRGACTSQTINFDYNKPPEVLSVKWSFGDPASGFKNTSNKDSTFHIFSAAGMYNVQLVRYTACGKDTVTRQVQAGALQFNLGRDSLICGDAGYLLDPALPPGNGYSYLWQDSSTAPVYQANQTGLYWVEVKNNDNSCARRDSIQLSLVPYPQFDLGNDLTKCEGQSATLVATVPSATYLWNDGSTSDSKIITQTGSYWLDVSLNGCTKRDSVDAVFYPFPVVHLGNDTTLCETQTLLLDPGNPGAGFLWQNNASLPTFDVVIPGSYWVSVTRNGCASADTINVDYEYKPLFTLGHDTAICEGMSLPLKPNIQRGRGLHYLWSSGSTAPSITVTGEGTYSLQLTNNCGSGTDEIVISKGVCRIYVPSAFTPNNDGVNDIFRAGFGDDVTEFTLQVYNRWGRLVFETNKRSNGWDGNVKGVEQPVGAYVWVIRFKTIRDTKRQQLKGSVMLIR